MATITAAAQPTNRLAQEKSPYLLQHRHNPVAWYAWGDEAFSRARHEQKPIFLSIGYSTCHWCHVMERETFENELVGEYLNRHFISIKVDREERPDVDKIYMTFVQASVGQGGWPLNVFLTPELKPFFGGTYFPPDNRQGRPGFLPLIRHIEELWRTRREEVLGSAEGIYSQLQQFTVRTKADSAGEAQAAGADSPISDTVIQNAGRILKQSFDRVNGGFGGAPKFPQPSGPQLLLRYARRFKDREAAEMVFTTCDRMAAGGICDQLGGGFSRYSVDAEWLVPHFEKMLYDNAQLVHLYLDAWVASGQVRHAQVARDILTYILRDMTHPEGGFYSAEDADSEGHEGKFYCWTQAELAELLAPEEFKVATRYFGITEQGNFVDHSHPAPLPNQNVLSVADPNLTEGERTALAAAKAKMLAARSSRVRPGLDDKVLASWNGLMLGAVARASVVLGDHRYRAAAEKSLDFVRKHLWDPESRTLFHRWREGERDSVQLLEGYAFLLSGVIELYEATLDSGNLEFAVILAERMIEQFYDQVSGGFWQSPATAHDLILRVKEEYDGAEPSGNSVAILSLLRLGTITERQDFIEAAEKSLRRFSARLHKVPQAVSCMLQAVDFLVESPRRAVIAGDHARSDVRAMLHAVHSVYQPNKVVLGTAGPVEPFVQTLPPAEHATLYLCTGSACQAPVTDPAKARELVIASLV